MKSRKAIIITLLFTAWMFGCAVLTALDDDIVSSRAATIDAAVDAAN